MLILKAANMTIVFRGLSEAFMTLATDGVSAAIQAFKTVSMAFSWAGGPHRSNRFSRQDIRVLKSVDMLQRV